jgi:DNA-binding response OmpR family regulator
MGRILVVDDESLVCQLFERILTRLGHEVVAASSGRTGVEAYRRHRPMATILDLHLPDMNGIEVLTEIRALDPRAPVIIWTGGETEGWESQARQRGVTEFLVKGFSLHELGAALQRVWSRQTAECGRLHHREHEAVARRRSMET